ncbi:MAG: preprotein translocase subunit YajC [Pontixanthobacter sp.]
MFDVLAAAAPVSGQPGWTGIIPFILMGLIFWFLIIRPQMKRQKEHREKIGALKKGDKVVTAGGLIGRIVRIDDDYADIELGQGVKVKAVRSTIGDVVPPTGKAAND